MKKESTNFGIEGVVVIAHTLHTTSEAALDQLLVAIADEYDVEDCNKKTGDGFADRPYDYYFAKLKETVKQTKAKCRACGHLNDNYGCEGHGFKCQKCHKVITARYVHNSTISFLFRDDRSSFNDVTLRIHHFDQKRETLFCYPDFIAPRRAFCGIRTKEQLDAILAKNRDSYEVVYRRSHNRRSHRSPLLAFRYTGGLLTEEIKINTTDTDRGTATPQSFGVGYKPVSVYKGKEYEGIFFGDEGLPVPESFGIEPTFRKLPKVNEKLHAAIIGGAAQVSDCGYYYQDGRAAFYDTQLDWMKLFVKHFVPALDYKKFEQHIRRCKKDGPGFICDLAAFVEQETGVKQYVENKPNIGNFLSYIGTPGRKSSQETQAFVESFLDPHTTDFIETINSDDCPCYIDGTPKRRTKAKKTGSP